MLSLVEGDECYAALKLTRRIIRHEDAVLGRQADDANEIGVRPRATLQ